MKNFTFTKTLLSVLLVALFFSSCSTKSESTPIYISGVSLIQASPTTEKLDVYIADTKASKADFSFGEKMDYLNAYSGDRTFRVTKKGSADVISSAQLKLEPALGYSVFVVDKLATAQFLFLKDELVVPAAGKAKIRFVNLSPDGGSLSLGIAGKTTDVSTAKAFKEYSNFETIDAADKVAFNIKNSTGVVETALVDVKIESGMIYTIWVKGLKSATDDTKFGAAIFTHK